MSEQGFQGGIGDTLRELGVAAGEVRSVETVSERPGHRLYRIRTQERSYILKSFPANAPGTEIESYELLRKLAVPTIAVVARTENALLLEDLTCSDTWRLATELDVKDRNTGEAIARWYRNFHEKGADLAADVSEPPPFLEREEDLLDGASIESMGRKLGLSGLDSWRLAAERIDLLKSSLSCFETTLNYNDFHWTNLAVSRNSGPGMEAVVFDYDLLGNRHPLQRLPERRGLVVGGSDQRVPGCLWINRSRRGDSRPPVGHAVRPGVGGTDGRLPRVGGGEPAECIERGLRNGPAPGTRSRPVSGFTCRAARLRNLRLTGVRGEAEAEQRPIGPGGSDYRPAQCLRLFSLRRRV